MKSAQAVVISIVIVAVILVIGIFILAQMTTTFDLPGVAQTVTGEQGYINQTGYQLVGFPGHLFEATNWAITSALNNTANTTIAAGNFTLSSTGVVTNATARVFSTVTFNYTYTYTGDTNSSLAANNSVEALSDGTPWLTIVIVVAFAVIVLGFLTSGFNGVKSDNLVY